MSALPPAREAFVLPREDALLQEALDGLAAGLAHCTCPTGYHALWGALKAAGVNRGIYTEAPVLQRLIAPLLQAGGHALVAGAADAAGLELLAACAGEAPMRFTVADQCPAPLMGVRHCAAARGLAVETVQSDLSRLPPPAEPWTLVFIHYTLSFMDAGLRRRVLGALAAGLAPSGTIVCCAKFGEPGERASPQAWTDAMHERLALVFAGHPEALAAIEPHLSAYSGNRSGRRAAQPGLDELRADFAAAGLGVDEVHETGRGAWSHSAANPSPDRQTSLVLLARART